MAKEIPDTLEVRCPCCEATLKVDASTGIVLSHEAKEKPRAIEDFSTAFNQFKGEAQRREDLFQKSVQEHKAQQQTRDRKFEELLKQAKEKPEQPIKRPFDFD